MGREAPQTYQGYPRALLGKRSVNPSHCPSNQLPSDLSEAQRQLDRRDAQRSNWSGTERWCEVFRQGAASSLDVKREAQWLGARRGSGALSSAPQEQATFPRPPACTKEPDRERLSPLGPGWENGTRWAGRGACPQASGADCLFSAGTEPTGFPLAGPKRLQPCHASKGCQGHVQERRVVPERKNTEISLHMHKGGGR